MYHPWVKAPVAARGCTVYSNRGLPVWCSVVRRRRRTALMGSLDTMGLHRHWVW